jgi:hypothetical protein
MQICHAPNAIFLGRLAASLMKFNKGGRNMLVKSVKIKHYLFIFSTQRAAFVMNHDVSFSS